MTSITIEVASKGVASSIISYASTPSPPHEWGGQCASAHAAFKGPRGCSGVDRARGEGREGEAANILELDPALVRTLETNLKVAALTNAQRTAVLASLHRELARP